MSIRVDGNNFLAEHIHIDEELWTVEDWRDLHETVQSFKSRLASRHHKPNPAWKCQRCGEVGFYRASRFKPTLFERQADDFRSKHLNCPLSIDGGGI